MDREAFWRAREEACCEADCVSPASMALVSSRQSSSEERITSNAARQRTIKGKRVDEWMVNEAVMFFFLPVSGNEAELHCSMAAAVWSRRSSSSCEVMLATNRQKKRGNCVSYIQWHLTTEVNRWRQTHDYPFIKYCLRLKCLRVKRSSAITSVNYTVCFQKIDKEWEHG